LWGGRSRWDGAVHPTNRDVLQCHTRTRPWRLMSDHRDAAIAAVAARQHAAFTRCQAEEVGFDRRSIRWRVECGQWHQRARDVFTLVGAPVTWRQRASAAVLEVGAGAWLSRRAAAALLGVPGFQQSGIEVVTKESVDHVVTLSRLHRSSLLPDHHTTVIDGIPCTTLARTLFDLAGCERPERVARAVDSSLNRLGLTIGHLEEVLALLGGRGRPGTRVTRAICDERGQGYVPPESELEALVDAVVAAAGERQLRRQVVLGDETVIGRVDFLDDEAWIVVEAQSRRFHSSWSDQVARMERHARLAALGYRVIEVTWWQLVHEPHTFIDLLRRARAVAA
jgi:very-short-patch-repair endonuclease